MSKVSIIIPNWNGLHLLPDCLKSVKSQSYKDVEVIIVDNGSEDGSVEYIKNQFPNFQLIELPKNIGFSPAVNKAIKKATGDLIALINNDTELDSRCLEYLVKAIDEHPEIGMVAAKMLQFNDRGVIDSAGDYIDEVGHANNIGMGEKDGEKYSQGRYVFLVTGGGSLFKKIVFDRVGLLDESYFAYFEDVDLCMRAQLQGFKGWFEPRARIYHIHKATSSKNKALTEYLQFRNMTQTIIKDFPRQLLWQSWWKIILVNINTVRYLIFEGYGLAAIRAELYILFHLGELLAKRRLIQSKIKVSPTYILENIQPKKLTFFKLIDRGI